MSKSPSGKSTLLYELDALVTDNLAAETAELAEALERSEDEVIGAVAKKQPDYEAGTLSQGAYWSEVALELALEDVELLSAFAIKSAHVNSELLGRIRAQSPIMTLGLVSDATPDFVGHFRKTYQLDELLHVHIIGSELDEERDYRGLLKLSAERLQAQPADVHFVDRKPVHLKLAGELGMPTIDLSQTADYRTAFSAIN